MSGLRIPPEGGSGGKRGHSNMEHAVSSGETKDAARKVRRQDAKRAVRDGLREGRVTSAKPAANLPGMAPAGLPALKEAIRHLHGLDARWLESVAVHEQYEGRTVWEGDVQVFAVEHPKASRVYAWSHETEGGKRRFHAVLGAPPVDGAEMAVRTSVLAAASA